MEYIDAILGAAEDWSFGAKLDLVRSAFSELVQSGGGPPAIVPPIRLDLIAHDATSLIRLNDNGLSSGEVELGRGYGRVVGIVSAGRDSV